MRRIGLPVGLDEHEHDAREQAVGDPHLLAVDLVVAVVELLGRGLDRLHVGAQLGLGEAERGADLAGRHPRQQPLALLVGAELHQQVGADEVRVDHARDRDPAARELLDDHRVGRQVEPHPAVLLGDRDPEQPELLHLLDDRLRELVRVVVVLGVRDDLLVDELADHLDDRALLVGLLVERRAATAMRLEDSSALAARASGSDQREAQRLAGRRGPQRGALVVVARRPGSPASSSAATEATSTTSASTRPGIRDRLIGVVRDGWRHRMNAGARALAPQTARTTLRRRELRDRRRRGRPAGRPRAGGAARATARGASGRSARSPPSAARSPARLTARGLAARRRRADAGRQPARVGADDGRLLPPGLRRAALQRAAARRRTSRCGSTRPRRASSSATSATPTCSPRAGWDGPTRLGAVGRARRAGARRPRDLDARRPVPDHVHVRHGRRAQGRAARPALPARPAAAGLALARRAARRARLVHGRVGLVEVGPQRLHRPVAARRRGAAARRPLRPAERLELLERERVDVLCMAPTEYRVIAKRATLRAAPDAPRARRRRRGAQPGGAARLARGDRRLDPRRLRPDRDRPAHRHAARDRGAPRLDGRAAARASGVDVVDGELVRRPAHGSDVLPALPRRGRATAGGRRAVAHRRPGHARRAGLPALRGPHGRRDHLGRLPDRPVRGRVRARLAPGGRRGRRRGGAGRRARRGRARGGRPARRLRRPPTRWRASSRTTSRPRPRRTSTRASSTSRPSCPKTASGKVRRALLRGDNRPTSDRRQT